MMQRSIVAARITADFSHSAKSIAFLLLLFLFSCDAASPVPETNPPDEEPSLPPPETDCRPMPGNSPGFEEIWGQTRRAAERLQHRLSDADPRFAGIFVDEAGQLTLSLTGTERQSAAELQSVLHHELQHGLLRHTSALLKGAPVQLAAEPATFTFRELAAWREQLTARLLGSRRYPAVISVFIDEAQNHIAVGIDARHFHPRNIAEIRAFVTETLGIPGQALYLFADQPDVEAVYWEQAAEPGFRTRPDASGAYGLTSEDEDPANWSGSIQDRQRPLAGGLRIRYGSSSLCSMGFFGTSGDREVMVTNAHCSILPHRTGNTIYWQGTRDNDDDEIGIEYAGGDPTMEACVEMNDDCWPCKWSDAALVQLNAEVPRLPANIVKTTGVSDDWMTNGSLVINPMDPVFTVVGQELSLVQGMEVHKVGGNSGWSAGPLTRLCYDSRRSSHGFILQCQNRARYSTDGGGTSGSPVFVRLPESSFPDVPNPVALAGIHWGSSGRDTPGGYSAFSPMSGILADFPEFEIARVAPPAAASLLQE